MSSSSAHESSTVPILSKNRYFLNFLSLRWRHSINFFSFFFQNFRSVSDAYSIYHFKNRFTKLFLKGDSFLIKNFSRPSSIPQVIAAIAGAELPNGHWGEVIQALATNATDVWNRFLSAWITLFSGKSRSEIRANKRSLHRSYWLHLQRRQTRAPECPVKPYSYLHLLRTCKSIE